MMPEPDSRMIQGVIAEIMRTLTTEVTDQSLPVEGVMPASIDGVYFRNGPGRFERGGQRYAHPFDGDGHITRLDIGPTGVRYSNRFVRTREYLAEEHSGRMRYRSFGTNLPGGLLANLFRVRFKNPANTSVIWHGGRLLALWEGGPPHRLDPDTLDTLGIETFDGRLRNPYPPPSSWLSPVLPFSAHPRLDPASGELINFGLVSGAPNRLLIYQVDHNGGLSLNQTHALPRFSFIHDFGVTRRWLCFLIPHADFDLASAMLGLKTPVGSLRIRTKQPMQALLIPRSPAQGRPTLIDCDSGFVFHVAQAFDSDDGALVLDVIRYPKYPDFRQFEAIFQHPDPEIMPRLERMVIDPTKGRATTRRLSDHAAEMPISAPEPFGESRRILYSLGAPPQRQVPFLSAVQRLDTDTGDLRCRDFGLDMPGEPMWVPDTAGGEGWLLTLVYRAGQNRTELLVMRADNLQTQASVILPHGLPIGFHGCWVPRAEL
ncbi:carotenoid oxygenase family protein [Thiorhodovibrio frisius]|uniref:Lignostilbene-alpha,beta-dioxygenase-like enzyme n=1 Tax=Thiorhodovibrio frisius TaxID=631362 RepID=H8Z8H6_9GAMM|nr:carotenoid oxygenase family protein [Thiorhodovibrio frisius]EIC19381.1 lignostilbene-alpha,beta-dioxygenase-like enzyme [Thiorhodovibrio frisius]WPL22319.1 8'-apo-beta-carotenal 15,15'-oxygenase [Thiorhodovibrio frisius]